MGIQCFSRQLEAREVGCAGSGHKKGVTRGPEPACPRHHTTQFMQVLRDI